MRLGWSRGSPRLTVLYPDASCRIELGCGKDVLCSGQWYMDVRLNGAATVPTSGWIERCWASDRNVDYLELEIDLGPCVRVQRHFVMARRDRFLLLADAVLATQPAAIEYCGTLPTCPGVTLLDACQTRETALVGRKPRARVLPLALPEWLVDQRVGQLDWNPAEITLRQTIEGRALFAPLFFDLNPSSMAAPLTWRQLTVAESQRIQPADAAVGYRVAIGNRQWLIYRSLCGTRNRSLLGCNLRSELLVARFDRGGETQTLIEVE